MYSIQDPTVLHLKARQWPYQSWMGWSPNLMPISDRTPSGRALQDARTETNILTYPGFVPMPHSVTRDALTNMLIG